MRSSLMKSLLEVSTSGELSVSQQQDCSSAAVLLQLCDRCDVPQEHLLPSLPPPPLRSDQPLLWIQSRPRLPAAYRRGQTTARCSRRRPHSSAAGEPEPLPTLTLHPHTGETGAEAPRPSSLREKCSHLSCPPPLQHTKPGVMKAAPQGSRSYPSKALLQKQAKVGRSFTLLEHEDGTCAEACVVVRTRRCTVTCGRRCRAPRLLTHLLLTGTTT